MSDGAFGDAVDLEQTALAGLHELLEGNDGDLGEVRNVLPECQLRFVHDENPFGGDDTSVVLVLPASLKFERPLPDVESNLLGLLQRVDLGDVNVISLQIRFQPNIGAWRSRVPRPAPSGRVGDKFELGASIGRGRFAEVFAATEVLDGDAVAVKFIIEQPDKQTHEQSFKRMAREVRTLQRINHRNVMPILDYGQDALGRLWYAMPRADGSLRERLHTIGGDDTSLLVVLDEVAAALDHLAENDVVHRDLSPSNVLFLDGRWVVSDFGLTLNLGRDSDVLTGTGWGVGTVGYQPPEFMAAKNATPAWDVYSLGQICLDLITGKPASERAGIEPDHAMMPAVRRACAIAPQERFDSCAEFVAECRRLHQLRAGDGWESPAARFDRIASQLVDDGTCLDAFDELVADIGAADDGGEQLLRQLVPTLAQLSELQVTELFRLRPGAFRRLFDELISAVPYGTIPFSHLDKVADFLLMTVELSDDHFATASLRWITEEGHSWNQFYVMNQAHRLGARLAGERSHLLRPALDGLGEEVIALALPNLDDVHPEARPRPAVVDLF